MTQPRRPDGKFDFDPNAGANDLPELSAASQTGNPCIELAKRKVIDLVWTTAGIEVPGITFPETKQIFEGVTPHTMQASKVMTVNNIKHAWQQLFDTVEEEPADWLTACAYNRTLGAGGLTTNPGAMRREDVRISGTSWKPMLPSLEGIQMRLGNLEYVPDPVDRGISLFCQTCRGQWFTDGNKRTAIMLANHLLIKERAGVLSIPQSEMDTSVRGMLLRYYGSDDDRELAGWLREHAIIRP